jgi:hypothetical protein
LCGSGEAVVEVFAKWKERSRENERSCGML